MNCIFDLLLLLTIVFSIFAIIGVFELIVLYILGKICGYNVKIRKIWEVLNNG